MIKLGRLLGAANRARLGVYLLALWKLFKHPDTPRAPRWIAIAVVAYALSPIDLIPDFIPVLGLLDEIILLPLAIAGITRLIPPAIMAEHRARAEALATRPVSRAAAVIIVAIWIIAATLIARWVFA